VSDTSESSTVQAKACTALGADQQCLEAYPSRETNVGELRVSRMLPVRDRRLIGPWCFVDRFGPLSFTDGRPMDVAPHPHIGLQTVTWLLDGEVVHDDSLGCEAVARPGAVNVMTAGRGIAHAERTPVVNRGRLDGVQLWVALPGQDRHVAASFQHVNDLPAAELRGGIVQPFSGSLGGVTSAARHYSELIGAEVEVHRGEAFALAVNPDHEHGILVIRGDCALEDRALEERRLYYLGTRRSGMSLTSRVGARLLLLGGPPFPEKILMWWNFVARTPEEIAEARADWEAHRRFGEVVAYEGPRLEAPALTRFARPNSMS